MKNYFKIFTMAAAGLAAFTACDESYLEYEALVPHNIDCIVNLKDAGEANGVLYTAEGINTISYEVLKTGARSNKAAKFTMRVLSEAEVNEKYAAQLVPYYVIPYELEGGEGDKVEVEMAADESFKSVNIKVDPAKVSMFIDEKQEANPEKAAQMKFVLPVQIYSSTDSVSAINNYKCMTITNIAFPAPSQLYALSDDFEDSSIKVMPMVKDGNVFTLSDCWFKNDAQVRFCDNESGNGEYYYINMTGKVKIGEKASVMNGGLGSVSLDFDRGDASAKYISYFTPFICTYNRNYANFKITYQGNKVYSGEGMSEWKAEDWSWDNFADTRYKIRAVMSDGTEEEWARHAEAGEVPSDDDVNNWTLETKHFWMANKGTGQNQWDNGQWKYHSTWHHNVTSGLSKDTNVQKKIRFSIYFSGSVPTHRVEVVE